MSEIKIDIETLKSLLGAGNQSQASHPWEIGQPYYIRTVTHHHTGRLIAVYPGELVLEDAAWIADSGRWAQALETGSLSEVEPFPVGARVIVGRGGIIDAVKFSHALPRSQK